MKRCAPLNSLCMLYSVLTFLLIMAVPAQGAQQDGIQYEPSIDITLPAQAVEGGLVPLFIRINSVEQDPITHVSMSVEGNPEKHRRVFSLNLKKPQASIFISTRFRAASAQSTIVVEVRRRSGASTTKRADPLRVSKPVNFTDPETLNVVTKPSLFKTDEIGQPILIVRRKRGSNTEIEIKGTLHHPMSPSTDASPGLLVNAVELYYRDEPLVVFETFDALSNDPFLQVNIDDLAIPGEAKMIWRDSRGGIFEKSN